MPLVVSSALEASAKTVSLGLAEAKEFGSRICVETDDPQVNPLAKLGNYGPAQSRQDMARLFLMQKECLTSYTTTCRAMNRVARWLAKHGEEITNICRFNSDTAPRP